MTRDEALDVDIASSGMRVGLSPWLLPRNGRALLLPASGGGARTAKHHRDEPSLLVLTCLITTYVTSYMLANSMSGGCLPQRSTCGKQKGKRAASRPQLSWLF